MKKNDNTNIVLTGFMGTGKTTVGKLLAKRLNRRFIDTDSLIEERQSMTIPEIFSKYGEATFRQMERDIALELGKEEGLVISTGGRMMLDPANADALSDGGRIFCLVATPQEILSRLGSDNDNRRPLLDVPDPEEQIVGLLRERRKGYQRFIKLKTDDKQPTDVTDNLLSFIQKSQRHFTVDNPTQPYEFIVGNGILPFTSQLAATDGMIVAITDDNTGKLYSQSCGSVDHVITIPAGSDQKTLATVQSIYDQLLDAGFDRSGTIIALGGSVVGDIAGFVAATFMRGVNLVQCPTSLLAMADTSIGGKNSIDLAKGKNLIGSFKQPSLVLADVATLATLPPEELISGMAEVIKHGLLADTDLITNIEQEEWQLQANLFHPTESKIQTLIAQAIQVKIAYVQKDPYDEGIRIHLNLGHTFAHAIEKVSKTSVRHGEAVAMGLAAATDLSARLGYCDQALKARIDAVLHKVGLPNRISASLSPQAILDAMSRDKKRMTKKIRLVLPVKIGEVLVTGEVDNQTIFATLNEMSAQKVV